MEYVRGVDLKTLLRRREADKKQLDVASAVYIGREVARALDYAHRRTDDNDTPLQLVHGDVTPQNILLSDEGEVKLADFGIARALATIAPGNQLRAGTAGFIAPEANLFALDPRADIYALGVTLYVALGGPLKDARVHLRQLSAEREDLSEDLLSLLASATATRPDDRFLSAGELERALSLYLARRHPTFTPSVLAEIVRRSPARSSPTAPSSRLTLVSMSHTGTFTTVEGASAAGAMEVEASSHSAHPTRTLHAPRRWRSGIVIVALVACTLGGLAWRLQSAWRPATKVAPTEVAGAVVESQPAASPAAEQLVAPRPAAPAAAEKRVAPGRVASPIAASQKTHLASRGTGFLSVDSVKWGILYIDDRRVADETPVYRLPISAGAHRVRLLYPEQKQFTPTRRVAIESGKTSHLSF
jgi:hypothetical protein